MFEIHSVQDFVQNPIFTISSFVIGLVGLVLAIVFFVKGRRFKAVKFAVSSRTIVENLTSELDGLEVSYKQVPQTRITVSRIYIWNGGTDTIRASDLTDISPLRVTFAEGAQLLDVRVVFATEPANQFLIHPPDFPTDEEKSEAIKLSFDYLDRHEGATLQLVHTGPRLQKICLEGKVKGADQILALRLPSFGKTKEIGAIMGSKYFGWFGVVFYSGVAILSILAFIQDYSQWYFPLLAVFGICGAWVLFSGFVRDRLPKSFSE